MAGAVTATTTLFPSLSDHHFEDDGLRVWLTRPWGYVSFFERPRSRLTDRAARFLSGEVRDAVLAVRPAGARLHVVHDWRNVVGYDSAARAHLVDVVRNTQSELGPCAFLLGENAPSIVRMGVDVAAIALRPLGVDVAVVSSLDDPRLADLRHAPTVTTTMPKG